MPDGTVYAIGLDFSVVWTNFLAVLTANIGPILIAMGIVYALWFVINRFNNATGHGKL